MYSFVHNSAVRRNSALKLAFSLEEEVMEVEVGIGSITVVNQRLTTLNLYIRLT